MNNNAPSVTAACETRHDKRKINAGPAPVAHGAFHRFMRTSHLWVAIIVALPLLLRLATGIALQVRKPVEFLQPATETGVARYEPGVTQAQILAAVKAIPEMKINGWSDLKLIDYRPKKGITKVRNHHDLETQIDAKTGAVIKTRRRTSDLLSRIHDGSEWGMRLWFFLPAALLIIYLWVSGLYLAMTETLGKWRARRARKRRRASLRQNGIELKPRGRRFNLAGFCLRYHYWLAVIVVFPWILVTVSGLALQLRHEIPGIDPGLERGSDTVPALIYPQVLDIARTIPELGVNGWKDIWRVYTHPAQGVMTVRTKRGVRAQIDAGNGRVIAVTPYSRDFWEDLHQGLIGRHKPSSGSPFGDLKVDLRLFVFLPVHLVSLLLWLTGVIYFLRAKIFNRRGRRTVPRGSPELKGSTAVESAYQPGAGAD